MRILAGTKCVQNHGKNGVSTAAGTGTLVQQHTRGEISPFFEIFVNERSILFDEHMERCFGNISYVENLLIRRRLSVLLNQFIREDGSEN